jgi:hypothetical protein
MIQECPHCKRTVSPRPGGDCPACRQNVFKPPVVGGRSVVVLSDKSLIPKICATCAAPTNRFVNLSNTHGFGGGYENGDVNTALMIVSIVLGILFLRPFRLISGIAQAADDGSRNSSVRVAIRLPQCKPCSRQSPLVPMRVDFDFQQMHVAVHTEFARLFRELNSTQQLVS